MSVDDVRLDVLGAGREPDRRRLVTSVVVLAVLAALVTTAWFVDHQRRDHEFAAIRSCGTRAQAAFVDSTRRVMAMAEYVRPSLTFAPESSRPGLYGMVAHEAAGVDDSLQRARESCSDIGVLRWHRALRTALTTRLAYVDAQLMFLAEVGADGQAYFQGWSQLEDLRSAAASALSTSAPGMPF